MYRYLNGHKKDSILLLELDGIKEWQVRNGEVVLIKGDTLYSYNDRSGLRKIVESNELSYNYHNVYQLGIK